MWDARNCIRPNVYKANICPPHCLVTLVPCPHFPSAGSGRWGTVNPNPLRHPILIHGFELCPRGLYLCGHSAGAHLISMMLLVDWTKQRLTPNLQGLWGQNSTPTSLRMDTIHQRLPLPWGRSAVSALWGSPLSPGLALPILSHPFWLATLAPGWGTVGLVLPSRPVPGEWNL